MRLPLELRSLASRSLFQTLHDLQWVAPAPPNHLRLKLQRPEDEVGWEALRGQARPRGQSEESEYALLELKQSHLLQKYPLPVLPHAHREEAYQKESMDEKSQGVQTTYS